MATEWNGGPSIWYAYAGKWILQIAEITRTEFSWGVFRSGSACTLKHGVATELQEAKSAAERAAEEME